ncbi:HAD family hydrolase [Helcococcus sueciensis]|uniref:HAD family hydrolase n=1 Tax=Helcococcus sueciensis TaxID=241555 RepID=UPI00040603C1|nr:HAD hydrolase-like protein [Helcococcus sueciensis]
MKKTLVFDMDGTLLDSMVMWSDFKNYITNANHEIDDLEDFTPTDNSMLYYTYSLIQEFYPNIPEKKVFRLIDNFLKNYYNNENLAKPFVLDTLERLSNKGYKMYVATATDYKYAEIALKANNLDKYITEIYTPDTLGYFKNELEYFNLTHKNIGANPENIIFFDDATYANRLANEVGFTTIGIYEETYDSNENNKEVANYFVNDFSGIDDEWLK